MTRRSRRADDEGWASLVLTGLVVPLLLALFLVLSLSGAVVYAWLRAGVAADDAAAAAAGDAEAVALASLSGRLARTAVVDVDDRGVVTVDVLALATSVPAPWNGVRVRASSEGRFGG